MDRPREDRIYELQQALSDMPAEAWPSFLAAHCPDDASVRAEVLQRQRNLESSGSAPGSGLAFAAADAPEDPDSQSAVEVASWVNRLGYDWLGEVGRGGMGVVHKVRDRKRNQTVALKTLREHGPVSLARFKQEFRSLTDVTHPNLAVLYEAASDDGRWFFTMEFVDGVDVLSFIRDGLDAAAMLPLDRVGRLRAALRQLAEGLSALHAAGKLHRDVKPSNVLVTHDRRVVLVDFGLVAQLESSGVHESRHTHVTGTYAYMSPEHAAGRATSAASDWYSVGVILFEALTGRLPFDGHMLDILNRKVREDGPAPSTLWPDVPSDLDALCADLLRREGAERPSINAILSRLSEGATPIASATVASPVPLVGRDTQVRQLTEAFELVRRGQPAVALVAGQSGAGKTALVDHFIAHLASVPEPVVLRGRCYEQESLPYKALDSAMDALARHLAKLPPHDVEALLPRDVWPLTRVFPVFLTVHAFKAARASSTIREPQELRRRAFGGLRELMARLGDRRPVIIAVDDLQWGDVDSAALLRELLRPPDPPLILFVGCFRSEDEHHSPFLRAITAEKEDTLAALHVRRVDVPMLNVAEVRDLVARLGGGAAAFEHAGEIARESGGNPFFVMELLRDLSSGDFQGNVRSGGDGVALDAVVRRRVSRLPERQQRIVEMLAVSSRPLDDMIVYDAAGVGAEGRSELHALRTARLVKTVTRLDGLGVEPYHDRIREAIRHGLAPAALASCHRALVRALEAAGSADPETLAVHCHGAGDHASAARHYAAAADRATVTLAFDRAARFYELALRLGEWGDHGDAAVRTRLGDVLANAGRGGEAAREYLRAADAHPPDEVELRRRAALQLLISGRVDEGLDVVRDVLDSVGMRLASTPTRAVLSLLLQRTRLRLRGLDFVERRASDVPPEQLHRVDVSWSIAIGLSLVDPVRAADFQALNLRLALSAGEPYRVARAVALEAAHVSSTGSASTKPRAAALLQRARDIASRAGDAHGHGMVALVNGIVAYLDSRWRDTVPDVREAQSIFRNECVGAGWELSTALQFELYALAFLGNLPELRDRSTDVLNEAEERQNLYVLGGVRTLIEPFLHLANDDAPRARRELNHTLAQWSTRGFYVQHSNGTYRQVELEIYLGNPAAAIPRLDELWKAMKVSHLMRVEFLRVNTGHLHLRALLACVDAGLNREAALREAAARVARLERSWLPFTALAAKLVRSAIASQGGDEVRAVGLLREAIAGFDKAETKLYAAAARRRLGTLVGGDEGIALLRDAAARFSALGVRNPERFTAMLAPGFRL